MSSISVALLALAAIAGTSRTPPASSACPATHEGVPLTSGQVLNGPPEELGILKPETDRRVGRSKLSDWPVAYIYEQGRQVYLTCDYAQHPQVVVKVARPVKNCRYTVTGRKESLACR